MSVGEHLSAPVQGDIAPSIADIEVNLQAQETPYTFLRAKQGQLFKSYFGTSAEVRLVNQTTRELYEI